MTWQSPSELLARKVSRLRLPGVRVFGDDRGVDRLLVLVNGLPGAGKTSLGRGLAEELKALFLSKDAVKEALAECVGGAVGGAELGGIAMDAVWGLAGESLGDVVIDSWWFRPRDLGFARVGIQRAGARRVAEVWCDVPRDVARARYALRQRDAIHRDQQRLVEDWDDWAAHAAPLALSPVIVVDTARAVDFAELAKRVKAVGWPSTATALACSARAGEAPGGSLL